MKIISYAELVAGFAEVFDAVAKGREEVIITRPDHEPVIIVSLDEYESLKESAYVMRSPANARRLMDAMERLEAGQGQVREPIEHD